MTRWSNTLPEVGAHDDPRGHGEMALQYLAWALQDERAGRREALLREVRYAAAHVLAWRLSLPKDRQGERVDGWSFDPDRYPIRVAIRSLLAVDASTACRGDSLRFAEAALRTLGKRLQAGVSAAPEPAAGQEPAETSDDDMLAALDALAADLRAMDSTGAIQLDQWPAAMRLVAWAEGT